jgi:hypothetical protein
MPANGFEQDVVGVVDRLAQLAVALLAHALAGGRRVDSLVGDLIDRAIRGPVGVLEHEQDEPQRDDGAEHDRDDPQRTFKHGSNVRDR